jgi:hypothetical protein
MGRKRIKNSSHPIFLRNLGQLGGPGERWGVRRSEGQGQENRGGNEGREFPAIWAVDGRLAVEYTLV